MNCISQAFHVARKDLRGARWLGVICVVLLAAATAQAIEFPGPGPVFNLWPMLVILAAMFYVAQLVQLDSPGRSDAFWVSRPLTPSAVLMAKFIGVTWLICVGLVAQTVTLLAYSVPIRELPQILMHSFLTYQLLLLVAALLAAITPNLRTFALVLIGYTVVFPYVVSLLAPSASQSTNSGSIGNYLHFVEAFAVFVLVLTWQYSTRRVKVARVAVFCMLIANTALGRTHWFDPPVAVSSGRLSPELRTQNLTVASYQTSHDNEQESLLIQLQIEGQSPDHKYRITSADIFLEAADGSREKIGQTMLDSRVVSLSLPPPSLPGVRLMGFKPRFADGFLRTRITASQLERIGSGALRPVIHGTVSVAEARDLPALPFKKGAESTAQGRRIRILKNAPGVRGEQAELRVMHLSRPAWPVQGFPFVFRFPEADFEYAIVNSSRSEGMLLQQRSSSGGMLAPLIEPGSWVSEIGLEVRTSARDSMPFVPDSAWLAEAKLHVVEWVELGSYEVTIVADTSAKKPPRARVPDFEFTPSGASGATRGGGS